MSKIITSYGMLVVWYQTFTRSLVRVEPRITINANHPYENVRAKILLYSPKTPDASITANIGIGNIPAGESTHATMITSEKFKLWSLRQPNLYIGQVVLFDASGEEIDRSHPTEFGIREFWPQGRNFYLNNQHVNFTLDCYLFNGLAGLKKALKAGVTLTYSKHAANGVNIISDFEDWAEECDRIGMGYIAYGVAVGYNSPNIADPEIMSSYRIWTQNHVRKLRNHPSILFWCLSTNFAGGNTYDPTMIGNSKFMRWTHRAASLAYYEHRRVDQTRLIYHHSSGGTGDLDTGNVYFNHLPLQSIEDWMSYWKKYGDRPYMFIEYMGAPLVQDHARSFTDKPFVSYATEYAARLAGEEAYREETDAYVSYSTHVVPRLKSIWKYNPLPYSPLIVKQLTRAIPLTYRSCRYNGVPADLWVFPAKSDKAKAMDWNRKMIEAATDVLKPDWFWIAGPANSPTSKDHQFYPGSRIVKSVLCVHDQPYKSEVSIEWMARLATGEVVASGKEKRVLAPWSRNAVQFQFAAPKNESNSLASHRM